MSHWSSWFSSFHNRHKNQTIWTYISHIYLFWPSAVDWITSLVNSEKSLSGWKLQGGAGLPRYCFPFLGFPKGSKSRPGPAPPHIRGLIFHSYTAHIFITNSIYENLKLMRPFPGIFPCLKSGGGHFLHLLLPFSFFSLINWRCWQYNWKLDPSQLSVKTS